jgi:ribosome modulation factor
VGSRKRHDDDWLDCQSPAWQQGYEDGYAGREPDLTSDGRSQWRLSRAQRNYRDGFSTGQCERQIDG